MTNKSNWPFDDPPNVETFTTRQVLEEDFPILLVTHDEDDGCWQVLCGTSNDADDGRVVGLDCMYARDPTIGELADLPLGWQASRQSIGDPWVRRPSVATDEDD